MKPYAHTSKLADGKTTNSDSSTWEPLFTPFGQVDPADPAPTCSGQNGAECPHCQNLEPHHGHLNKVAHLAAQFAAAMFPPGPDREAARQWGRLAGLWHDLGKFTPEWQAYLKTKADPHQADAIGTVDHSTAGAQLSVKTHPLFGHLIAYGIAGHHCGLLDVKTNGKSCQEMRLSRKDIPKIPSAPSALTSLSFPPAPPFLAKTLQQNREGYSSAFFTRLIFSSLVDADFLATEAFMNPNATDIRNLPPHDALQKIDALLTAKIQSFGHPSPSDIVNQERAKVVQDCADAASQKPGLFTLTVPTGGGKTLSSLHFGLKHAIAHGQQRIIYVVPFTSIIEQNADVIREIVAPLATPDFTPLIEHHTSLSPDKETEQSRLATENWDAPIIITTAVQFFESLFASKTSCNRKLHHITNAVVILDEAQTLPVKYLSPCLRTLQELTDHYHTTVVLCTATQPAIKFHQTDFPIGLKNCREIIKDPSTLFEALERVKISDLGRQTDADLASRILQSEQILCIVNRRRHAQDLVQLLPPDANRYHLSALMCPTHRSQILNTVRQRLNTGQPVRLISTQLIEAGVDVDFPVVFRSLAGLDSIAQAAGRCNRHGKLPHRGETFIFQSDDQKAEAYFRETAQVAAQIIDLYDDLLDPAAIHHYFDLYYYQQKARWDEKGILDNFSVDGAQRHCPFRFNYRTAATDFQLINDWQTSVLIPFDETAAALIAELRNEFQPVTRRLLRALQRYTVQISPQLRDAHLHAFESIRDDQFFALVSTNLHYSSEFGLILNEDYSSSQFLNC